MPLTRPISQEQIELIAARFRVIGEPMRISLLDNMRDGECTVGELVAATGASQQNVSKHLKVLHNAELISRRPAGRTVYYGIADETVFAICEKVCDDAVRDQRSSS
ncbi:MAG: ArsR/SmtB family transcription factor [Solirubrobacterales bacterium]